MDDMYREVILEHYKQPHNAGTLDAPDISHEDSNPLCGDRVKIDL
jgi:nitrogen fixation NifU-like protein